MLKIREMYRNPSSREHRIACFLIGLCISATSSVFLILANELWYALLIVPSIMGLSQVCAECMQDRMQLRGTGIAACAAANLLVLAIFIILFG